MRETPSLELGVHLDIVNSAHKRQRSDETSTFARLTSGALQIARVLARLTTYIVRRGRPACVHVNTSGSFGLVRDILILAGARVLRTRSVLHLRFGRAPALLSGGGGESGLLRAALRLANLTIVIDAESYAAVVDELGVDRVRYIPNFIHVERYGHASGERKPRVLFLGTVHQSKGVSELLSAWERVRPEGWTLDLVGPVAPQYEAAAQPGEAPTGVRFHGSMDHGSAMKLLAESSVLVLPSHTEGFPNVILEAMASGTPVVASTVGAVPDMLAAGAGRLVEPRDVVGLGNALREVCASSTLRQEMAARALARVQAEYASQPVFSHYRNAWLDL